MGHLRALPSAVSYVVEAYTRGAGQAGCVCAGGGGAIRAYSSALGVALAFVSSGHNIRSEHVQKSQS